MAFQTQHPGAAGVAGRAVDLALSSLPRMIKADGRVCYTLRRTDSAAAPEGESLRYAAIVALGVAQLDDAVQTSATGGFTAADLVTRCVLDLPAAPDLGDLAMVAWAAAETSCPAGHEVADQLLPALGRLDNPSTVALAWALTALVAHERHDEARRAAELLLDSAGPSGLFPHWLRPQRAPRWRRHVGCFADQVYPLQALARFAAVESDSRALAAAERCADVICQRQGTRGQWWWHYDVRTGDVVEGYPVYAVHQAGMAPMALMDLAAAGGHARLGAVALGLDWLGAPQEGRGPLLDDQEGLVWRKVGRREPARKAVRALRSAATAVHPSLRVRLLDAACPPGPVDFESRPYEAGWSLYAWLRSR